MDSRPAPSGGEKSRIPGSLQSVSSTLRHALGMPRSDPLRPPRSSGTRTKPGPSSEPPTSHPPDASSLRASTQAPSDVPRVGPILSTSSRSSIPVRSKKDKTTPVSETISQQRPPQSTRSTHPLNNLMPEASRSCDSCHDALTGIDSSEYYLIPLKPNHPGPTIPPIPYKFPPDHPLLTRAVIPQPKCHLLDLPLELRQKIHDQILAQYITVDLRLPRIKYTSPCSSWIQTCSQLYQECAEDYYKNLCFVLWAPVCPFPANNNFVLAKRLRAIGAEFLEQQRRRPHMTPRRVRIMWGLIGDVRDNQNEERNNRWIEARDLIWDYFYWAHHSIPNVRLMVKYEWFMADGRRAIFCEDTRERQLWQCAKFRDGGDVNETTSAERESMALWNRQLGQWSHGLSQSTRVQRLWERGMPLFPLEHPAGQGGDE